LQKRAMDTAQAEANEHKGAMASRYDTFKEEAQALRDGHAKQCQELAEVLARIQQLQPSGCTRIGLGAVLITSGGNYFVSSGLVDGPLVVDGVEYECINPHAPLLRRLQAGVNGQPRNSDAEGIRVIRFF